MLQMPRVSVCVPNLNGREFLPERFETIFKQTLRDWEVIVCDGYSDDGAWEYIQELAARESRMRISQTPRKGIYAGFNDCIAQARGEFVYIATSDDTMSADCLEKMVPTLEANPDCGLCQCQLVIIDEKGVPYPPETQWNHYTLGQYNQDLVSKTNRRLAPHDGIVHPALFTIYTSITQLLIRRSVFDRIGLFDGRWGSISDFEWEMRAGLVENCIYIPDKLATWRLHPNQATQDVHSPKARLKMIEMGRAAFAKARACKGSHLDGIDVGDALYFLERDIVQMGFQAAKGKAQKARYLLGQLAHRPRPAIDCVLAHFQKKEWGNFHNAERYDRLKRLLLKYNVPEPVFE
jgi:glycosyltransferase involved in cell wall biosynthesis